MNTDRVDNRRTIPSPRERRVFAVVVSVVYAILAYLCVLARREQREYRENPEMREIGCDLSGHC